MKVETFLLKNSDEPEMGLVVSENDDWVLVKHIPADHVIDGFRLYRKKFLDARDVSDEERRVARVLQLKKVEATTPEGFRFQDMPGMLKWMEDQYGLFEFLDEDDAVVFYGCIHKVGNGMITLEMIDADGHSEVDEDHQHVLEQISMITFGSDYLYSLGLLRKDNATRNGLS